MLEGVVTTYENVDGNYSFNGRVIVNTPLKNKKFYKRINFIIYIVISQTFSKANKIHYSIYPLLKTHDLLVF